MADTARVRAATRLLLVAGAFLMAAATVAQAQAPVPTASPVPTATPSPVPTATWTPTAAPTFTATPAPTLTPSPTPTPDLTPTPTASPTEAPRQATPTATTTPGGFTGATLTICHATGGDPAYEPVTVSADSFDDHFDHAGDVIPAPAAGCDEAGSGAEDVTVCHATGDPDAPFALFAYEPGDLGGHEGHPGDLIPAPNGTCPGLDEYAVPSVTPTPTRTSGPDPEPTATPGDGGPDDDGGGRGDSGGGGGGAPLPTFTGSMVAFEQGATTVPAQQLPFTGLELWLIATAGLALMLMGLGLRMLAQPPAVGVTR